MTGKMGKVDMTTTAEITDSFTDVLYLTNNGQMAPEVKQLLENKTLSFSTLPLNKFAGIRDRLGAVGTVIIDTQGLDASQQQKLAAITESLDVENIEAILLSGTAESSQQDPSLTIIKDLSLPDTTDSISLEELSTRIDVNLACRKKSSEVILQAPEPAEQAKSTDGNKLADRLNAIEALVDNMSEQLRLAGLVQRDFLPSQLPQCDQLHFATTFLPAGWVSGDIYDVERIDEQHIGFYIADVVGHGMPAALLTIFLKQALVMRETTGNSYRIFSPAEVMKNLNVRMTGQKLSGFQFASCCYCLMNIKTLELTYARGGHPYPLLLRANQPPQQLQIGGSLLGIFPQAEYTQQTVQLQSGDKLLLYSDGAEPLLGTFDDQGGFNYSEEFCEIKDLPIIELTDRFNALVKKQTVKPLEIDDITTVGMEIL